MEFRNRRPAELAFALEQAGKNRRTFLEAELSTRWAYPLAGPLPPSRQIVQICSLFLFFNNA